MDLAMLPAGMQAGVAGLAVGLLFGLAARLGDFCTLSTLETAILGHDYRRLHVWGVALGTAIIATHLAAAAGLIRIDMTYYHALVWNPLASLIGGLVFGYGMALAGNCGFGAIIRAGGGDIRSIIIAVVLGIAAFATLSGPLAPLRAMVFPQTPQEGPSGIAQDLSALTGAPALAIALLIGTGLVLTGLRHPRVRGSGRTILCAALVGLSVALAFMGTTLVSAGNLDAIDIEGISFTAPLGRAILYLMTSTGMLPSFSVGLVAGTLGGSFAASVVTGRFRWEACDDPRELGRQVGGAVLMGIGGVIALGCTIGQGLSAFATLAWSGPVTLGAISVGAYVGLVRLVAAEGG